MAKSSQIQQQDQTERPASPIPFALSKQVGFNLKDIFFNTNNEVSLLYPKYSNKETFKCVSDFIYKCCLREPFTKSPNMFKEYLAKFWYLATAREHSKVSFSIPTYVLWPWFETIGYVEKVPAKGTLKRDLLPPSREATKGYDALADSTAEADPVLSAPNDSIPQQQGMDEGTKNTSFDHISAGASSIARQVKEEEAFRTIKLRSSKAGVHVIASKKTKDDSVPSAGQAGTQVAAGEKNINQATIYYKKGRKGLAFKDAEKEMKTKKFNFVTEDGKHIHLTKEQINQQKKIEEEAKAEAAKRETEDRKEELVDLLGPEVVNKQDFVAIEDLKDFPNTMLYTVQEIFFRLYQGPGLDDHARTFGSLLLAEIDERNLNPLKQMRVIEQLRQ
ncbi:hypothetical protein Tco_0538210 [Tanacetum coccineum]